jgi:L-alanine-DL-glutamate epimerase-like enolase superfamily enzyme
MKRRDFLKLSAVGMALAAGAPVCPAEEVPSVLSLRKKIRFPVKIASIELLQRESHCFLRSRCSDGATGIAFGSARMADLSSVLLRRVAPHFLGRDARDVEALIDTLADFALNDKQLGPKLWSCAGWIEFSLFDLLGQVSNASVGELLGGVLRREIPVCLFSMRPDMKPEEEIEWLAKRLAETNSKAVKLQIGARESGKDGASSNHAERLVSLARKTFGDRITIEVDANGSYDPRQAIEIGKMLEAHKVYSYAEPCAPENFEASKGVADALEILIAAGKREASDERFRWMIRNRAIDIVRPDLNAHGGFIRTMRLARWAAGEKMEMSLHSPHTGSQSIYMLQFASATPNLGRFQEIRADVPDKESWLSRAIEARGSLIKVPSGPGLGMTIDPDYLKRARKMVA